MKIVNETVYDSDGLYNLLVEVNNRCETYMDEQAERIKTRAAQRGEIWTRSKYYYEKPLPEVVRIGYSKPGDKDTFVSITSRYSDSPRIGIVRPADLPVNPLVVLAQCAEDAERTLPDAVLVQIVSMFCRTRRGHVEDWAGRVLVQDAKVTFSLKVKKADVAAAKKARKQARIESLMSKIRHCDADVRRLEKKLSKLLTEQANRYKTLDKLVAEQERMQPHA